MAHPSLEECLCSVREFLLELPKTVALTDPDVDAVTSPARQVEYRGLEIPRAVVAIYGDRLHFACQRLADDLDFDLATTADGGLRLRKRPAAEPAQPTPRASIWPKSATACSHIADTAAGSATSAW